MLDLQNYLILNQIACNCQESQKFYILTIYVIQNWSFLIFFAFVKQFFYFGQMKQQSLQFSNLEDEILKVLANHPTPESLKNKHFLEQLSVLMLNKKPATHSFICDDKISIQIQFKTQRSKEVEQYQLNPFNKIATHYYQVTYDHNKYQYTLNCNDKTLYQKYNIKTSSLSETHYNQDKRKEQYYGGMFPQEYDSSNYLFSTLEKDHIPQAYEPLYYFPKNTFQLFLKNRNNLYLSQPLEKIKIFDWVLKVVNISKSNSYSFIIEVYNFKFLNQSVWVDEKSSQDDKKHRNLKLKDVGSIVYQEKFQMILEKMRLQHIRKMMSGQNQDQDSQISMCFHLRNIHQTYKLPKMSQFVALDKQGDVLKFNKNLPVHFVAIGQIEGMCSFPQPINLNKQQKQFQLRQMNNFSMKGLFQILNKQAEQENQNRKKLEKHFNHRKQKIGAKNFNKMIQERLQNPFLAMRIRQSQIQDDFEQDDSLWSDTNQDEKEANQEQEKEENQIAQRNPREYYQVQKNNIENSSSESEQEYQNEYFRRYREQIKKNFTK